MSIRRSVFYLLGLAWLVVLLTLPVHARTLELREAQADITIAGQTTQQAVSLPYHWDRLHAGWAGSAKFYIPFELAQLPTEQFSLYVPRLGNAYEIWLNGSLLQRNGDLEHANGADFAKVPRFVAIPSFLLQTSNILQIHIRSDIGRRGGLSPSILGPTDEVYPIYIDDYRKRSTGSFVVVIMSTLLVIVTIALWVTQVNIEGLGGNRHVALYLLAGLGELFWIIRVSDVLIDQPPLNWPWWGGLMVATTAAWMATLILFCVEVALWGQLAVVARLRQWLAFLFVASFAAAYIALAQGYPMVLTVFYATLLSTAFAFAVWFVWRAGHAALSHQLIAAVVVINTVVGIRDWWVFRFGTEYGGNTYMRYSVILFGLMFSYIVVMRFRQATLDAQGQVAKLHAHVAQRECELNLSYQRLEILAREQERTTERTRILRDMHDGVGAHISIAMRQLESGSATSDELMHTMRDSLDQLKLTVDAIHLQNGDVTSLLANLRYRLEPRFKASETELLWDVDLLEPLAQLDSQGMRHLQFIVYEALSNVLQHAHASILCIELRATPTGGAMLRIIDNGRGFDLQQVKSNGFSSLRERATMIGAVLRIDGAPGKTVVELIL